MLASKAYVEHYNQVTGIVYRKISDKYGLEVPTSKWKMPPRVVENNRAKILWDFRVQTDILLMLTQ